MLIIRKQGSKIYNLISYLKKLEKRRAKLIHIRKDIVKIRDQ